MAVRFLNNSTAISAGGDNNEIYIWRIKDGKVLKKIVGVGEPVWSVGINGNKIAWGNIDPCPECENMGNRFGKLQKYINLNSFEIESLNGENSFHRVNTTYKNYSLSHRKGGDYGYDAVLDIKKDGVTVPLL